VLKAILQNLRDPGWWFTIVFAGLVVGLFTHYLKDWTSRLISHFSKSYRVKRDLRKQQFENEVQSLARNPHILTIEYVRTVHTAVLLIGDIFLLLAMPTFVFSFQQILLSESGRANEVLLILLKWFMLFSIPAGILGIRLEIRLIKRFKLCEEARLEFRKGVLEEESSKKSVDSDKQ